MASFTSGRYLTKSVYFVALVSFLSLIPLASGHAFEHYAYSRQQVLIAMFTKLSYEYGHKQARSADISAPFVQEKPHKKGFNLRVVSVNDNDTAFLNSLTPAAGETETYQLSYDMTQDDDIIGPKLNVEVEHKDNLKQVGVEAVSSINERWNLALAGIHQTIQHLDPNEKYENNSIFQFGLKYRY